MAQDVHTARAMHPSSEQSKSKFGNFGGERGRTLAAVSHTSRSATVFKQPPQVAAVQRASVKTHSKKLKHDLPSSLNRRHRPRLFRGASVKTHSNLPKHDLPSSLNSRHRPRLFRGASVKTHSNLPKHDLPSSLNSRQRPRLFRGASVKTHSNLPKVDLPSSLNSRQRPRPSRGASVKTHSKMLNDDPQSSLNSHHQKHLASAKLHCSKPTAKLHCSKPKMLAVAAVQKKLGSKSSKTQTSAVLRAKADKAQEHLASAELHSKKSNAPVAAVQKKLDSRPKAPATLHAKADKAKEPAEENKNADQAWRTHLASAERHSTKSNALVAPKEPEAKKVLKSRQKLKQISKLKPTMTNADIPDDSDEQIGTSHLPINPPKVVTLGIDFAGVGLAGLGLNQIKKQNPNKFDVQLNWVSEPNPGCQKVLKFMWKDQKHELVVHESVEDALEERSFVHVHQWSPECQPFSTAGKQNGLSDGRGQLVGAGLKIVMKLRPWVTIMEQSPNLVSKKFRHIAKKIVMRLRNECGYRVFWKVIQQADLGIPHSRKRFILVGIAKERYCKTFVWPRTHGNDKKASKWILRPPKPTDKACILPTCPRQKRVVKKHLARAYNNGIDPRKVPVMVDVGATEKFAWSMVEKVPCITAARGSGHWVSTRSTMMNTKEIMACFGITTTDVNPLDGAFPVSKRQFGKMLGNAVPANMIAEVAVNAMYSAGIVDEPLKYDIEHVLAA